MPGGQERALRRRIKSVQSTKKITRAMELISASRIVKAQQKVAAARPYAEQITEVIQNLSAAGAGGGQALLTPREKVENVGVVILAADRGLAGGYNSAVIRLGEQALKEAEADGKGTQLFAVGRKSISYFRYRGRDVAAEHTGFSDAPTYEDARRIAEDVVGRFEAGELDRVELAYTEFITMGTQRAKLVRFIPLETETLGEGGEDKAAEPSGPQAEYEYEPAPDAILERLLPRYVESRLFAALLEAAASEHAARQRAMKSATDNATELIKRLDRQMNRARQDAITTEIIEIASGAEALNQMAEDSGSTSGDHFTERDATPYDSQAHAS